ncbi:MAG: hypothetical protein HOE40_04005 [Candidatus Pacebacteria bacterium]|jgi:hypothetical protein|nr:hypothetical protein [Candidatus Paceibacterota bacterium]
MEEGIRITFFNKIQKGKLLGTFGIHIKAMDMFFTDLKLLATNSGGTFIAPPCRTHLCEETGKDLFQNYWWFSKEANTRFQKGCNEALNAYLEKYPDKDPRKSSLEESVPQHTEAKPAAEPEANLPF